MKSPNDGDRATELGNWSTKAGIKDHDIRSSIAVDLGDILSSAEIVSESVAELLALDPTTPEQADRALTLASRIGVQLFDEMKGHLEELERNWPALLERLADLSPQSEE